MDGLLNDNYIVKKKDISNISYILEDKAVFFETAYKVLQNKDREGFIKAVKVTHNGKIKLIYDTAQYKSLTSIISNINEREFLILISKIFNIIIETTENGFMQIENINIDFEDIYVDTNNLDVFLIYLPINAASDDRSKTIFEGRLKNNIARVISYNSNINGYLTEKLYSNLLLQNSTLEILSEYIDNLISSNINFYESNNQISKNQHNMVQGSYSGNIVQNDYAVQNNYQHNVVQNNNQVFPIEKEEVKKKGGFGRLFKGVFGKKSKEVIENYDNNKYGVYGESYDDDAETQVLSGFGFVPTISICGEQYGINIIINKEDFIIGKNPSKVDGIIGFNNAISRVHCRIKYINGAYYINDENSANGTFVNGKRVVAGTQQQIKVGDVIKLANSEFIINAI